ncbi:MAG: hydroxyethylthiazole kinase [Ruminococcaceae bacterium]|nr:hydroxyethylthiazole kinase [Oscillospiraceae bacterium]
MFEEILNRLAEQKPIVHCITNFVTVNDCANIVLASGGSPTMAHDVGEVGEITEMCQSLVLNMGTLGDDLEVMIAAGKKANELGHPVVLDPVAVGASKLRTNAYRRLEGEVRFSVIRGNISEIKAIATGSGSTKGVDADDLDTVREDTLDQAVQMAKTLSRKTGAVIAISGAIDIVADREKAYVIRNGHPMMARITGTGCMLTALIGAFCGANPGCILDSTAAGVCSMGICGELAHAKTVRTEGGTLSFRTYLIDYMSNLTLERLNGGMKIEIR